jgi:hypothetical protein
MTKKRNVFNKRAPIFLFQNRVEGNRYEYRPLFYGFNSSFKSPPFRAIMPFGLYRLFLLISATNYTIPA